MDKTLSAYRELGPKRYRETSGLYYEDFEVGDIFEHRPGRTITDVDNIWMTLLTLNVQQVHFDAAYAVRFLELACFLTRASKAQWILHRACHRQKPDGLPLPCPNRGWRRPWHSPYGRSCR